MTRISTTKLGLLLLGFLAGGLSGSLAVRSSAVVGPAALVAPGAPRLPATVSQVQEVASGCGVYGLPGSPATVALTSGYEGRPVRVAIESDIFGGDEIEGCILSGLAGLPMSGDTMRVVLPVYQPTDTSEALASW